MGKAAKKIQKKIAERSRKKIDKKHFEKLVVKKKFKRKSNGKYKCARCGRMRESKTLYDLKSM